MADCFTALDLEHSPPGDGERAHARTCETCRQILEEYEADQRLLLDLQRISQRTRLPPPDAPAHLSVQIPGYTITRELHRGAQGVVYEALQISTQRRVALKVILGGPFAHDQARERFRREVKLVAGLRHANIVTVFDSGETHGVGYYVMDYVEGTPLDKWDAPLHTQLLAMVKACEAVGAAHAHGVVHRDLKPSNILISEDGEPHVLDFGLAKQVTSEGTSGTRLSTTGSIMGTLAYMAPEQARGDSHGIGAATDVYALGVILYRLATGEFPYDVYGAPVDVLRHIQEDLPVRPRLRLRSARARSGAIDSDLERIILCALAKEQERRYPNATALRDDLRRYLAGEPVLARGDNLPYLLRIAGRRAARKHYLALLLLVLATATGGGYFVPFAMHAIGADEPLVRLVFKLLPEQPFTFIHTRLIGVPKAAEMAALGAELGIPEVTAENRQSWRSLHGRLLERLARSACRVMAIDLSFEEASPHDQPLLRGIEAVKAGGIPVLVAVSDWWFKEAPKAIPSLQGKVGFGGATMQGNKDLRFHLHLLIAREDQWLPSLALATYAAFHRPHAAYACQLDKDKSLLTLHFYRDAAVGTSGPSSLHIQTSKIQPFPFAFGLPPGARPGDDVVLYMVMLPEEAGLQAATTSYADVLRMSDQELRDRFADRAVMIGDISGDVDTHEYSDGRYASGCHFVASVLEHLLQSSSVRLPWGSREVALAIFAAALFGLLIGRLLNQRMWARGAAEMTLFLIALMVVIFLLREGRWLNPVALFVAILLASEGAATLTRAGRAPQAVA